MSFLSLWSLGKPHGKIKNHDVVDYTEYEDWFVSILHKLIEYHCLFIPNYGDGDKGYQSFLLVTSDGSIFIDMQSSDMQTLGIVDGNRFFLKSEIVFRHIQRMSEQYSIYIHHSQEDYFAHMAEVGIITPSNGLLNPIEYVMSIGGKCERYICVSNHILLVNIDELPAV